MATTLERAEEFMTLQEVADALRVDVRTIYRRNMQGTGPRRLRIGGEIRVRRVDFDAWVLTLAVDD